MGAGPASFHDPHLLNALKDDRMASLQAGLRHLAGDERRAGGAAFNTLKNTIEESVRAFATRQTASQRTGDIVDPTMPARHDWQGTLHPVTLVIDEICAIFRELGFTIAYGPEAETEWYNFGALYIRLETPAMG